MTNNYDFERRRYSMEGKPMGSLKKSNEPKRKSQGVLSSVDEPTQFALYEMQNGEAHLLDDEQKYNEASTGEYLSSFVEEPLYDQDYGFSIPQARQSMTSYAAPTKASWAKKNEKVDVLPPLKRIQDLREQPSLTPCGMQRSSSVSSNLRGNSPYRNLTDLEHDKDEKPAKGRLSRSTSEFVQGYAQERRCSAYSAHAEQASGDGTAVFPPWKQQEENGEEAQVQSPSIDENEHLAEDEELMDRVEELKGGLIAAQKQNLAVEKRNAELEKASEVQRAHTKQLEERCVDLEKRLERASHPSIENSTGDDAQNPTEAASSGRDGAIDRIDLVQQEVRNSKGKLENLGKNNEELLIKIQGLETTSKERDEAVENELQSSKADAEDWQRKHDTLSIRTRELEAQIEARNYIEPELPLNEAMGVENKRLQPEVNEMKSRIDKMQKELKAKQKELSEMTESAQQLDQEAVEANGKMEKLRSSFSDLNDILGNISQANTGSYYVSLSHIDALIQDFANNSVLSSLFANIKKLMISCVEDREHARDTNESMQRQLENKDHEITMAENALAAQSQENIALIPCLPSPVSPGQMDRDRFEGLFKEEREKRKLTEEKLRIMENMVDHDQQARLEEENRELCSRLDEAQAEHGSLRQKAEDLQVHANMWKSETEEKSSELEKRSLAFEKTMDQQQREIRQYIKEYRDKAREEANWEVASLQAKLEVKDRDYTELKHMFDKQKGSDARRDDHMNKLELSNQLRGAHIANMEQAYLRGDRLPTLPSMPKQNSALETSSLSPSSTCSTFSLHSHPASTATRIPRCKLPAAVQERDRELAMYRAQLKTKTQEELLGLARTAPFGYANKELRVAADDVMEKVRRWKLGALYPPDKTSWEQRRMRSAWEMWEGPKWAEQLAGGGRLMF